MCDVNCLVWGAKHLVLAEVQGKRVCEVGSYDVNGSLRHIVQLLEPAEYVGVDIVAGPGVDVICPAQELVARLGEARFDIVLSTCMLEHVRDWKSAVSNIKRICKPNGLILIIVPYKWFYHEYPGDFWRYSPEDLRHIYSDCSILALDHDTTALANVYAKVRKPTAFQENDLSDYCLHSVVVNHRTREIRESDFNSFYFRRLVWYKRLYMLGLGLKQGLRDVTRAIG